MVTGDHPRTAMAVARQVGISAISPRVVVPDDLESGGREHVETVGVFARTRPEQKVEIVRALQQRGHVVAMTGDGVNDAPALRAADIGVAMGKRGTEVARQAAELVLADDDLGTVVAAIEEGRRITTNIRAFLRYALSGGLAEILVMVVAPFLGMGVPLLPGQILWVNMLTHGLPGVAFGAQPADPQAMHEPSQSPDEFILGGGLWKQISIIGTAIAAVTLIAGAMATGDRRRCVDLCVPGSRFRAAGDRTVTSDPGAVAGAAEDSSILHVCRWWGCEPPVARGHLDAAAGPLTHKRYLVARL